MRRLKAGYCRTFDSNGLKFHRVELAHDAVDGFVFWTRNIAPFLDNLEEINRQDFPFVIRYGINEDSNDDARNMRLLNVTYGPRCAVWCYAPAGGTALTRATLLRNFTSIADNLRGATDEVTVNLHHLTGDDVGVDVRKLMKDLTAVAGDCGMRLTVCSQPDCLVPGSSPARCIDTRRLSDLAGHPIAALTYPKWSSCLCAAAYDIGTPMPAGCTLASTAPRRDDHDSDGDFLAPPPAQFEILSGADLPF